MSTAWGRTAWRRASQRRCAPGPRESASARSIPIEFRRSFLPLFAATCICGLWPACCRRISQEQSRRTSAMPWKHSGPRSDRKTAMGPESVMDRARHRNQAGGVMKAMDRKTIAVFIDASPSGQRRAVHAATLAQRWGATVVGVQVVAEPSPMPRYMYNARGRGAVAQVLACEQQLAADARAVALVTGERFRAQCARLKVHGEFRSIGPGQANQEAILNAFQSDLVVAGHPEPHGLPPHMMPERILLESGGPLLIIPNAWQGETIGEKIVIGIMRSEEHTSELQSHSDLVCRLLLEKKKKKKKKLR